MELDQIWCLWPQWNIILIPKGRFLFIFCVVLGSFLCLSFVSSACFGLVLVFLALCFFRKIFGAHWSLVSAHQIFSWKNRGPTENDISPEQKTSWTNKPLCKHGWRLTDSKSKIEVVFQQTDESPLGARDTKFSPIPSQRKWPFCRVPPALTRQCEEFRR